MIFQDNIAKKYLQIHSKKYGILNNFYFYCKESFIYNKLGFILSLLLVPAGIIKSVTSIFITKVVIDSLESFRSEYPFLINGCYCCLVDCRTVGKEYDGAQYEFIRTDTAQQIVD